MVEGTQVKGGGGGGGGATYVFKVRTYQGLERMGGLKIYQQLLNFVNRLVVMVK